jgi:hypothetical protein
MKQRHQDLAPIVLRLRRDDVRRIDEIAAACRMTRTGWIRRSLARCASYAMNHELPVIQTPEVQAVLQS